jgi:hypothetical protein
MYPPLQYRDFDLIKSQNLNEQAAEQFTNWLTNNTTQVQDEAAKQLLNRFPENTTFYQYDGSNHEKNLKYARPRLSIICIIITIVQTCFTIVSAKYSETQPIINMSENWRKICFIIQLVFLCIGQLILVYRIYTGMVVILFNRYKSIKSISVRQIKNGDYKINPNNLKRRASLDQQLVYDTREDRRRRSSSIYRTS